MKAVIAIESCVAHYDRVIAQLNTWAGGSVFPVVEITGPALGVADDYQHLPEKTHAICRWAVGQNIDHLFKVDSDTYVHTERLLASGFEPYSYVGYKLDTADTPYCSGPHYWLSRKALKILAEADWSKYPAGGYFDTCEDMKVGTILAAHGITPHHDPRYAPFEPVLPENNIISSHLSSRGPYQIEMMYAAHKAAMGER